jgi:hypothetical protein
MAVVHGFKSVRALDEDAEKLGYLAELAVLRLERDVPLHVLRSARVKIIKVHPD